MAFRLATIRTARIPVAIVLALALGAVASGHDLVGGQIERLTRSIAERPDAAALYLERAQLFRMNGEPQRAEDDLRTVERLAPGSPAASLCRAALLDDAGRELAARELLDGLLARQPRFAEARILRAGVLTRLDLIEAAVADYDTAIRDVRHPSPDLYLARARLVAEGGGAQDLRLALGALDDGIARCGAVVSLEDLAIDLEVRRGAFDVALARLARLEALAPRRETLLARRGAILHAAGREVEAWVAYSAALDSLETMSPSRRRSPDVAALEGRIREALRVPAPSAGSGGRP